MALYTASVALLIGVPAFMFLYLIFKGSSQVMLCTECQQCRPVCPLLSKGCNPVLIMKEAKMGMKSSATLSASSLCTRCGACQRACSRGLAPYQETGESKKSLPDRQTNKSVKSKSLFLFLCAAFCLSLVVAHNANTSPLRPDSPQIKQALNFFKAHQEEDGGFGPGGATEWAMIAITAAGQDPKGWYRNGRTPYDYLKARKLTDNPYDWMRMILALTAIGDNSRDFNGVDYVAKIKNFYQVGQFGDPLSLRDDYWAVVALVAAGEINSREVRNSVSFILKHQGLDGSWSASTTGIEVCADNTAAAMNALIAAGEKPASEAIVKGLAYLKTSQNSDGGFPYLFMPSNAATDSSVIQALSAAGIDPSTWTKHRSDPVTHLRSLQQPDGSFNWTAQSANSPLMMTAHAVPALLGKVLPIQPWNSGLTTVDLRIEGKNRTLLHTQVTLSPAVYTDTTGFRYAPSFSTPLSAISEAVTATGMAYRIERHPLGLFIKSLAGESDFWQYRVNDRLPWVAANEYRLRSGDEVIWFFDHVECKSPLRLRPEKQSIFEGETVRLRVEQYDDNSDIWKPASDTSVFVTAHDRGAGNNETASYPVHKGEVSVPFRKKGSYRLYAEKEHAVRSRKRLITVEERNPVSVGLRIENNNALLWEGKVDLLETEVKDMNGHLIILHRPNILGLLEAARRKGHISYEIIKTSQGVILFSINGLEEDNSNGSWWFEINGARVSSDIDEQILKNGDAVLLYRSKHFRPHAN
jgi:prenyltransferase beta subunit/ferredoxin